MDLYVHNKITMRKREHELYTATLMALSPYKILERGYSIVTHPSSTTPIRDSSILKKNEEIHITFHKGKAVAHVNEI
jgi:exonuclease VII large subunit